MKPGNGPERIGSERKFRPICEFAIVFSLGLICLTVIIPGGTQESDNFGLSPRMVPVATIVIILCFAVIGLLINLTRPTKSAVPASDGLAGVLLLCAATLTGAWAIHQFELLAGGTILVFLTALAVGMRNVLYLSLMVGAALLLLSFIKWAGL
ncbi:hypothetical protein [Pararhizobium sp. IMCC21322]|uniref:hypothetical protein n=1 Tax=Pararhizobium sp. IMCC21322 TaxID=3067903 RepID=UPI002740ABD5|nr:hypothetical protein [Pararhizobium sp. IMCC21322]